MARLAGSQSIKGWQEHELVRDLALGEESPEALAIKYDRAIQTIYDFRWRNKHRINVVLAEWSNQFSDLWSVKKHARIADLQADLDSLKQRQQELLDDATAETEMMQRIEPTAAPVRVNGPEWRAIIREKARLSAQIEKSMGQEGRAGLRQQPKPLNIQPAAYVEPAPLSQIEQWEQDQHDARRLKIEQWLAQREAEYKRQHPNWQTEEAAEQEAFEVVFDAIWQRLGTDDAFRQAAAERFGPGYWLEADAMTDAHRVETLERQILLHAETRAEVASSLADADMNPTSVPVPVEDSATKEETEPVELVRMPPPLEPKAKTPEPAPEPEPVPVEVPEEEPESEGLPPVAAEVDRAARKLAESIWFNGPLERTSSALGWTRTGLVTTSGP